MPSGQFAFQWLFLLGRNISPWNSEGVSAIAEPELWRSPYVKIRAPFASGF